jgi:hypothetical protein
MKTKNFRNIIFILVILFVHLTSLALFGGSALSQGTTSDIDTCPTINISPPTLPNGTRGIYYSATITASGGTAPYTFTIEFFPPPPGLTLQQAPPNSAIISGIPSISGTFWTGIRATDANGCFSARLYTIIILPCPYEDLFDDGVLDWTVVRPNVTETGGFLVLSPAGKKAISTSPAAFAGCAICTLTAEISLDGGLGQKAWMLTHRIDKNNQIEILFDEAQNKVSVKQKTAGSVVVKAKANFNILPNTIYRIALSYDGTNMILTINGANVLSFVPVGVIPSGIIGFQDKDGTLSVNRVCVK